jgi:hypothetical protein
MHPDSRTRGQQRQADVGHCASVGYQDKHEPRNGNGCAEGCRRKDQLLDADASAMVVHTSADNYANTPVRYHSHDADVFGPDPTTLGVAFTTRSGDLRVCSTGSGMPRTPPSWPRLQRSGQQFQAAATRWPAGVEREPDRRDGLAAPAPREGGGA